MADEVMGGIIVKGRPRDLVVVEAKNVALEDEKGNPVVCFRMRIESERIDPSFWVEITIPGVVVGASPVKLDPVKLSGGEPGVARGGP